MSDVLDRLKSALADRYTVERELGSGGMATVYLAEDLKHERKVAVKVLHPELTNAVGADRFLREIRITAKLSHPHILTLLDSGHTEEFLYFVMPYVPGESLRDRMDREGPLPIDEAVRIAEQVAAALAYAHRHGVIHRDIKPENILLHEDQAMVADFGIAVAVTTAGGERVTETGIAVGTPDFMSPEQASGTKDIDERSDIYSLGCVLYEMLGGATPHTGPTPRAILTQKMLGEAPPIRSLRPDVDASLEAVLAKALETAPGDRFATAKELGDALRSPDVGWSIAARRLRRRRSKIVAASAALLVVFVITVGVFSQMTRNQRVPTMLVVLPLENLGGANDNYLAEGLTAEIQTRLAAVGGVRTIGRRSARQYANTEKAASEIGDELGVDYIVDGTVRRQSGDGAVRITAELIRVSDGISVWNEGFNTQGLEDLIRAQISVARSIVGALQVHLTGAEQSMVEAEPTQNPEAYDYYLIAQSTLDMADDSECVALLDRAVELDPNFAAAWALRASVQAVGHMSGRDWSLSEAEEALAKAKELGPNLPETRLAEGWLHYAGHRDYEQALEDFWAVRRLQPSNSEAVSAIGFVHRRQGRWEEATATLEEAFRLEPLDYALAWRIGVTYATMRQYDQAQRFYDRATRLRTNYSNAYASKAVLHVMRDGTREGALQVLEEATDHVSLPSLVSEMAGAGRNRPAIRILLDYFAEALADSVVAQAVRQERPTRYYLLKALVAEHRQPEIYRAYNDSIRAHYAAQLQDDPEVSSYVPLAWRFYGLYSAYAGDREEAVRAAEHAADMLPVSADAFSGADVLQSLVEVYVLVGDYDSALERLDYLLSIPSGLSVALLRSDPLYATLRNDPRFQALLEKYE